MLSSGSAGRLAGQVRMRGTDPKRFVSILTA